MEKNLFRSLSHKYPKVKKEILKGYKEADESIIYHADDPDLDIIEVELPPPPDYHEIDGFGLPAREQKFAYQNYPMRLKEVEKECETLDEVWDYLEKNKRYYTKEIAWIRKQWYRRLYGYWFFNNGKPTFIDGWHYFYINFWHLDSGLPDYRDRDRKFFHFARFTYNDTTLPSGEDIGFRICFGFNYPKHKREGATSKAGCINYEIISRTIESRSGIQSMNEKDGTMVYKHHIIAPWKKLPFFFKPNYEGSTDPKSELSFNPPATRLSSKGSKISSGVGLGSLITYGTAEKGAYDGSKLYFYHGDEVGKTIRENVWERHQIAKDCCWVGSEIHGLILNTSTVGEMEKGGGQNFFTLCEYSNYANRNANGQTTSGLYNLFIPAYEGRKGFIDQYGNSVIENPEPWQDYEMKRLGMGAKEYILNQRKEYLDKGDHDSLNEDIRRYPITFRECFRGSSKDTGFNINKIETRIDELRFKKVTRRGDFNWVDDIFGGDVEWTDNPEGRFVRSYFGDFKQNAKANDPYTGQKVPLDDNNFYAGADPFNFNKARTQSKGGTSKGGGAVFWGRDYGIDPKDKDMAEWESYRFICTYEERAYDKDEYVEDMLKMCIFHSCKMFPEADSDLIFERFEKWGFGGYLMFDVDMKSKKVKETPGAHSNYAKQPIFRNYMTYIERHCHRECHIELLYQFSRIKGIDDMTNYDLFAAGGYAMLAEKSLYRDIEEIDSKEYTLDSYVEEFTY